MLTITNESTCERERQIGLCDSSGDNKHGPKIYSSPHCILFLYCFEGRIDSLLSDE